MAPIDDDARRAHRLLRELIELEPDVRMARLDRATVDDPRLRAEVLELLAAADRAGTFLERPAVHADLGASGPDRFVGSRVGGFVLREVLGSGGMGTVFRARQEEPPRDVALKVMNPGLFDERAEGRFRDEVRALGRLEHPGIARLYASGAWDAGFGRVPWYAMELVEEGRPITAYAAEGGLDRTERLRLLRSACDAVHYGHQRGVIHRDLKPANLLVDRQGRVRVIDFGVARLLGDHDPTVTRSLFGGAVGTIPYMSPEQFSGDGSDADIRTDVYALGVVLYELLTGRRPRELGGVDLLTAARAVLETDPIPPSRHDQTLRGDLEAVVLTAMARDKADRYQTVDALSRDLDRYVSHRPVEAHQPSAWRRLALFGRRHRTLVTVCSVAALLLITATVVSTALAVRLDRERDASQRAARFLAERLWRIDPERMASGLRAGLKDEVRRAARWGREERDGDRRVERLEDLIAGADFTGLARETLERNFFDPALREIETLFAGHPELQASLLQTVASAQMDLGLVQSAIEPQRRAVAIRAAELGEEDPATLSSRAWEGRLLSLRGEYAEARRLQERVVETQRRVLGARHPDVLMSMNNLATTFAALGDLDAARELQVRVLEGLRRELGEEHRRTLTALSNLARTHHTRGEFREAQDLHEEALVLRRRVLGEEDGDTIDSMGSLAQTLFARGDLDHARELQERVLDARRRSFGRDHPETLLEMGELAQTLRALDDLDGARALEEEVLAASRRVLGPDHPHTLTAMNNLAVTLKSSNELDGSRELDELVLAGRRRVLGSEHPDTLISMINLAHTRRLQGDLEAARALLEEAVEVSRREQGDDHPIAIASMFQLAHTLDAAGETARAKGLAAVALRGVTEKWGPDDPRAKALERLLAEQTPADPGDP